MPPDYEIRVRETWLSRRPDPQAFVVTALTVLLLTIGSVVYWLNWAEATSWMPANFSSVFHDHAYFQAWTALFAHADARHLLSNSLLFFILGSFLAGYFGYWVFPITGFLVGGVINLLVLPSLPEGVSLLGASGMVFWMGGVWLILYLLIDVKRTFSHRLIRAMGVALLLFFPAEAFDPQISYRAHLYGFLSGLVCGGVVYHFFKHRFEQAIVSEMIWEEPSANT